MNSLEQRIESLLLEKFKEESFKDFFLVETIIGDNKKVQVFIDSDTKLTIGQCAKINRYLQGHIDEAGWLGEKYVLDVSSPGIGKPLKFQRQYPKNIGRKVAVKKQGGEEQTGILKSVMDTAIILEDTIIVKEGKKKRKEIVQTEIPFAEIKTTVVKITF